MISQYVRGLPHNCEVIQWIPVSERLPQVGTTKLLSPKWFGICYPGILHESGKFQLWPKGELIIGHEIIAWAELPKGYLP